MQQRQPRLGDILDDYCPRERRITNHAVVAMIGPEVKQTRCTTCDAEHEYKHAKVPRQRRKSETPAALYSQVLTDGPKRVTHDPIPQNGPSEPEGSNGSEPQEPIVAHAADSKRPGNEPVESDAGTSAPEPDPSEPHLEDGPVHRPLIRATLPRPEGQPPPTRPVPEFTIRQPGGRPNRFRHRHGRGGPQFHNTRSNGHIGGGRPPVMSRLAKRHGHGRKRSK